MVVAIANSLELIVENAYSLLRGFKDDDLSLPLAPGKWSKKEILGHLIDSAANNHQRFIRAQLTDSLVFPNYQADLWVECANYNQRSWSEMVEFWRFYNRHLAHILRNIKKEKLNTPCTIGENKPMSLLYLAEDYLSHLQHHVKQMGIEL